MWFKDTFEVINHGKPNEKKKVISRFLLLLMLLFSPQSQSDVAEPIYLSGRRQWQPRCVCNRLTPQQFLADATIYRILMIRYEIDLGKVSVENKTEKIIIVIVIINWNFIL